MEIRTNKLWYYLFESGIKRTLIGETVIYFEFFLMIEDNIVINNLTIMWLFWYSKFWLSQKLSFHWVFSLEMRLIKWCVNNVVFVMITLFVISAQTILMKSSFRGWHSVIEFSKRLYFSCDSTCLFNVLPPQRSIV